MKPFFFALCLLILEMSALAQASTEAHLPENWKLRTPFVASNPPLPMPNAHPSGLLFDFSRSPVFTPAVRSFGVLQSAIEKSEIYTWAPGLAFTDQFTVQGWQVKKTVSDLAAVWASVGMKRLGAGNNYYDKLVVYCNIYNVSSERRIEVNPADVTLEVLKPRPQQMNREDVDHLAIAMVKRARMLSALAAGAASMQTTQSTTYGSGSGTVYGSNGTSGTYTGVYSSTTTTPDYAARRRADAQAAEMIGGSTQSGEDLKLSGMRANTLLPGQGHGGLVIFDQYKNWEEAIIRVTVEGQVFEFPFTNLNTAGKQGKSKSK